MDPNEEIPPKRSKFWFVDRSGVRFSGSFFDQMTVVLSAVLAFFSFVIFWPIISQIEFNEAFYTPLVPSLLYLSSLFGGIEANLAIKIFFVVSLMVSTVGIYLLMRDLTRRQVVSILAALIYLIPPIPVFILTYFRRGLLESELASAKSFFSIVYGDGAHFLGLALIPYAAIFCLKYLKAGTKRDFIVSVFVCSLVFLASRSQVFSLLFILFFLALSDFFLGLAREKLKRLLMVVIATFGLVSFWYTPQFLIESFLILHSQVFTNLKFFFPLPFTVAVLGFLFSLVFFAKREDRQPIFVSFLLFVVFLAIVADWILYQRSLIPHAHRLIPNLHMFFSMAAALTITAIFDQFRLTDRWHFESWSLTFKIAGAIVFAAASFLGLAAVAYFLSPVAIVVLSGPSGIWSRIRSKVIAERESILAISGQNFKLVGQNLSDLEMFFGIFLSLATVAIILFYYFFHEEKRVTRLH